MSSRLNKQNAKISAKHDELVQQYTESDNIAKTLPEVQFMFDSLRTRWLYAPKKILSLPEPQLTVSYIVWLMEHHDLDLNFEFKIDQMTKMDIISDFTFTLSGVSNYNDLYAFIYYMTHNPILYKFEKINMRRNEEKKIEYQIQMKGFFLQQDILPGDQFSFSGPNAGAAQQDFHNIFYTTYSPPVDDFVDTQESAPQPQATKVKSDLVDPQQASLLALTKTMAYVMSSDGTMKRLSVGSPVDGGKLVYINQQRSEAQFQLYGGKSITLGLGYKK